MTIKRLKAPFDEYGVDSSGTVWSFKHGTKTKVKPREDKDGYLRVNLADKGQSKNGFREIYIHKLVARAFHGKGQGVIMHKDGNRQNNKASNLAYGSQSQNIQQREQHKKQRGDSEDDDFVDVEDTDAPFWRFDTAVTAKWEMTPEGYLIARRIVVAQAKPYEYADASFPEGKRVEFVTVGALQTLADTLVGKPLTDEHPASGKVESSTWRTLARGIVQRAWVEHPSDDNDLEFPSCVAEAVISDQELIEKVLRDNIREVSPGYDATLAPAPETPEFMGAHFLQTSRAGNHLAVTRAGRGGSASAIRLDAGHALTHEDTMEKDELKKKLDEAEAARADMQAKLDALQAKVDAFEAAKMKAAEEAAKKDEEDSKRNDAADFIRQYNERRKVEDVAARVGVKYDINASTLDIQREIVKTKLPTLRVDSDAHVLAGFEVIADMAPAINSAEAVGDAFRRADSQFQHTNANNADDELFAAYDRKG